MRNGSVGKYGTWSNEFSVTYRLVKGFKVPNPTLSAILMHSF